MKGGSSPVFLSPKTSPDVTESCPISKGSVYMIAWFAPIDTCCIKGFSENLCSLYAVARKH